MQAAEDLPFIADCSPAPSTHTKERLAIRGELIRAADSSGSRRDPRGGRGQCKTSAPIRSQQMEKWDFGCGSLGKLRIGTKPKGRHQSEHKIPAGIPRLE